MNRTAMTILNRLAGMTLLLSSMQLATSCDSSSQAVDTTVGEQDEDKLAVVNEALRRLDELDYQIDQKLLLTKMRDQERNEIKDNLYWVKTALFRLTKDLGDTNAVELLDKSLTALENSKFLIHDVEQFTNLIAYLKDTVMGSIGVPFVRAVFEEGFDNSENLGSFSSVSLQGNAPFLTSDDKGYAKVSGFGSNGPAETWMLSPRLSMSAVENPSLRVRQAVGFLKNWEGLSLKISTDYTGGDPRDANWDEIEVEKKPSGAKNWAWVSSEEISLDAYQGQNIVVAFHYNVGSKDQPTWEIEWLRITGLASETLEEVALDLTGLVSTEPKEKTSNKTEAKKEKVDMSSATPLERMLDGTEAPLYYMAFDKSSVGEHGYSQFNLGGTRVWIPKIDSKTNVQSGLSIGGFKDDADSHDWLISSEIDLADVTAPMLEISQRFAFFTTVDDVQVKVSTDYKGKPSEATWTNLDIHEVSNVSNFKLMLSKKVNLSAFAGKKIVLGFEYKGSPTSAMNWSLNEVLISK